MIEGRHFFSDRYPSFDRFAEIVIAQDDAPQAAKPRS
jgi:hypothetical protein